MDIVTGFIIGGFTGLIRGAIGALTAVQSGEKWEPVKLGSTVLATGVVAALATLTGLGVVKDPVSIGAVSAFVQEAFSKLVKFFNKGNGLIVA